MNTTEKVQLLRDSGYTYSTFPYEGYHKVYRYENYLSTASVSIGEFNYISLTQLKLKIEGDKRRAVRIMSDAFKDKIEKSILAQ